MEKIKMDRYDGMVDLEKRAFIPLLGAAVRVLPMAFSVGKSLLSSGKGLLGSGSKVINGTKAVGKWAGNNKTNIGFATAPMAFPSGSSSIKTTATNNFARNSTNNITPNAGNVLY